MPSGKAKGAPARRTQRKILFDNTLERLRAPSHHQRSDRSSDSEPTSVPGFRAVQRRAPGTPARMPALGDPQSLDLLEEGRARDAQPLRLLDAVPTGGGERLRDRDTFRVFERDRRWRRSADALGEGEVTRLDLAPFGEQRGSPEGVLELAHVPRPVVALDGAKRGATEPAARRRERAGERLELVAALAQRREGEGQHLESVVQIGAEASLLHALRERLVGGGDDPRVAPQLGGAAEPAEGPRLEHLEQLWLHLGDDLADLVEEERAAAGDLEQPALGLLRVGEGAPLVAEQLTLEEGGAERRTVHLDEGLRRTRRAVVDATRDEALPGARLADDEHGHIVVAGSELDQPLERRAAGARIGDGAGLAAPRAQHGDLAAQPHELRGTRHGDAERLEVHGLLEEVERALLHGAHGGGDVGMAGEHDDAELGIVGTERLEQRQAARVWEPQVHEHDVGRVLGGGLAAGRRRAGGADDVAKRLEVVGERLADGLVVVHDEYGRHRARDRPGSDAARPRAVTRSRAGARRWRSCRTRGRSRGRSCRRAPRRCADRARARSPCPPAWSRRRSRTRAATGRAGWRRRHCGAGSATSPWAARST